MGQISFKKERLERVTKELWVCSLSCCLGCHKSVTRSSTWARAVASSLISRALSALEAGLHTAENTVRFYHIAFKLSGASHLTSSEIGKFTVADVAL